MVRKQNDLPRPTWSLDQLKSWLQATSKRWALDAYWMGRALIYARDQMKEEGLWMSFCRESCPGMSYETVQRYVRLAESVKDSEALDGIRLTKAYELTGMVASKRKALQPGTGGKDSVSNTPSGAQPTPVENASEGDASGLEADAGGTEADRDRFKRLPELKVIVVGGKLLDAIGALALHTKEVGWQDLDVTNLRTRLREVQAAVEKTLSELPRARRKAG